MNKKNYYGIFLLLIPLVNLIYVFLKEKRLALLSLVSLLIIMLFISVEFIKLRKSKKIKK